MRALIQRASFGRVTVAEETVGQIDQGLVVFLGVGKTDGEADLNYIVDKITNLRIFEDEAGKLNLSVKDVKGKILLVSQFTLYGDCRKGRRPSFTEAANPDMANTLYNQAAQALRAQGLTVETGRFQATMLVEIHNDGPVTLLVDSNRTI